jgi:hypothetical protein
MLVWDDTWLASWDDADCKYGSYRLDAQVRFKFLCRECEVSLQYRTKQTASSDCMGRRKFSGAYGHVIR